ncbi:MAG: hypothetical protein R3E97_09815 [Candidatus Eisenbacteria bacterium]
MHEQPLKNRSLAPPLALLLSIALGLQCTGEATAASSLSEAIAQAAAQNLSTDTSVQPVSTTDVVRVRGDRATTNPEKPKRQSAPPSTPQPSPSLHIDAAGGHGGAPAVCGATGPDVLWISAVGAPHYRDRDCGPSMSPTYFGGAVLEGLAPEENGSLDHGTRLAFHFGGFEPGPDQRIAFETEVALANYAPSRDYEDGIEDVYEFTLGAALRLYGTSARDPFGLYGTAGVRGGLLRWDYTSTLVVASNHGLRDVDSDHVSTWSPYFGAGVTLFRGQPLQLDVSLVQAIQFYGDETDVGFENDVFETTTVTQLRIGLIGLF